MPCGFCNSISRVCPPVPFFGRSSRASRFKVLLWVASVTVPGPALMRGSRWFWWCAAACLRAAWRAVLSAGGGAWWAGLFARSRGDV